MVNREKDEKKGAMIRREILKKTAVTSGATWGLTTTAVANRSSSNDSELASKTTLLNSKAVKSIEEKVPGFQARENNARVTAVSDRGHGQTIEVRSGLGTLFVSELPDGSIGAIFRFPNDIPRRELNTDVTVPDETKMMLVGSSTGAHFLREATSEEQSRIRRAIGVDDSKSVQISTTSESDTFEITESDLDEKKVKLTKVRPAGNETADGSASDTPDFEITNETTVTPETSSASDVTAQSCDCDEIVASIWLCFSTLNACSGATACAPFGGAKAVAACAVASGCIFGVLSEMFDSTGPGCVDLGQDLWDLCATECVYD